MMEFVSWDDDYIFPIYGKIKNVPGHQPDMVLNAKTLDLLG